MNHPTLENIRVLCRSGAETATLFRLRNGQNLYDSITRPQLLTLIESAAEALRKMDERTP